MKNTICYDSSYINMVNIYVIIVVKSSYSLTLEKQNMKNILGRRDQHLLTLVFPNVAAINNR